MDKELRDRWCAALRSGKYRQCRGMLNARAHGSEGFCCLGVLNVVAGRDQSYNFGGTGLTKSATDNLMRLNDGDTSRGTMAHTFSEIADWIEANIEAA